MIFSRGANQIESNQLRWPKWNVVINVVNGNVLPIDLFSFFFRWLPKELTCFDVYFFMNDMCLINAHKTIQLRYRKEKWVLSHLITANWPISVVIIYFFGYLSWLERTGDGNEVAHRTVWCCIKIRHSVCETVQYLSLLWQKKSIWWVALVISLTNLTLKRRIKMYI